MTVGIGEWRCKIKPWDKGGGTKQVEEWEAEEKPPLMLIALCPQAQN